MFWVRYGVHAELPGERLLRPGRDRREPTVTRHSRSRSCRFKAAGRTRCYINWAQLLEWVFDIDMQHCPNCCGGELKVIAAILERRIQIAHADPGVAQLHLAADGPILRGQADIVEAWVHVHGQMPNQGMSFVGREAHHVIAARHHAFTSRHRHDRRDRHVPR